MDSTNQMMSKTAAAGYHEFVAGRRADLYLNAIPNLKIGER